MSKSSEAVKRWRRNMRERLLQAFGKLCCVCGYQKCPANMELHHPDMSTKEFSMGDARGDIRSWDRIVVEARKCVLVCNRCHGEIHNGLVVVPSNAPRFDETMADYRGLEKLQKMTSCPVCGNPKAEFKLTCSKECAGKRRSRVAWESVNLSELLKTKSRQEIADDLGVSEAAVRKRERKLSLGGVRNGIGPSC